MDQKKLFEAATSGDIELLNKFLQENPLILTDVALTSPLESPMHVATKAGRINFIRELLKNDSELASQLSSDGFRPLDIASVNGNVAIVRELLRVDGEICRLKGKDGRTALHYAAINGKVLVIDELLSACSECIKDITVSGETALHLAVKNNKIDGFIVLFQWMERLNHREMVNWVDFEGNTVLHLAAIKKQFQTIKVLLSGADATSNVLEMNATNSKGLTAMDILDILMENPNDVKIREILRTSGALRAQDLLTISSATSHKKVTTPPKIKPQLQLEKNFFKYFMFQPDRDSPGDTRNTLLVVAVMMATVTFQAGVNPPTGILKVNSKSDSDNQTRTPGNQRFFGPVTTSGLAVASAILGSHATGFLFLFANTLGLTASLSIIIYLTVGFPFYRELLISTCSIMFAYGCSINSVTENDVVTYVVLGIAYVLPFSLRWLPRWGKKAWKRWRKRRGSSTIFAV